MPQMHSATIPACPAGTQVHRCIKGHPLNPLSLAAWQEGFGKSAAQSYAHVRKCKVCGHEIPRNWVRLGCERGCQESVCYNMNCKAKVLDSAKLELSSRSYTTSELASMLLQEESLLLREAAVDSLRELGSSARSAAPALEKLLLHEVSHHQDQFHGSSCSRNSIRHTFLGNDGTHPLKEYQGWRVLRVKAAITLALMKEMQVLEDVLYGEFPNATSRPEVREAGILGIAELGVQGRGAEAGHLAEHLGQALSDNDETVRMAAAHAVRALASAGMSEPAIPHLVEALKEQNVSIARDHLGGAPIRKWQDHEGKRLFELDVVAALSLLGTAVGDSAAETLVEHLARGRETSTMRWATADALAQSGSLEALRTAKEHQHVAGPTDILHPRRKPQSAAVIEEVRRAAQTTLERTSVK